MKQLLALILISIFFEAHAQFAGHYNTNNITGTQNTLKTEIPLATPTVVGSTYYTEEWKQGEVVLKNQKVFSDLTLRVEMEQGLVEFKVQDVVRYIDMKNLESVNFLNLNGEKIFLKKAQEYSFDGVPLKGIVEVQPLNQYSIVRQYYIEFLSSNYNVAMDVGSKDHRKIQRQKTFIHNGEKLIAVKGAPKKFTSFLENDKDKALKIIKENSFDLSEHADLIQFIKLLGS